MTITKTLSDNELLRKVQQELEWNPRVEAIGISATVQDGVVTLAGSVGSYAKKMAALDAGHRVTGVLDIADEMVVQPGARKEKDRDLAQAVRAALIWDVFVPDDRILSTVSDGWVTLEGEVDRWQQRADAGQCVERLNGVRGVTNRIEVKPLSVDAVRIKTSIENALARRAAREAKRIQVSVKDGVVTLEGTVDSWAEKNSLGQLAHYSPGVRQLLNRIQVDPYH